MVGSASDEATLDRSLPSLQENISFVMKKIVIKNLKLVTINI